MKSSLLNEELSPWEDCSSSRWPISSMQKNTVQCSLRRSILIEKTVLHQGDSSSLRRLLFIKKTLVIGKTTLLEEDRSLWRRLLFIISSRRPFFIDMMLISNLLNQTEMCCCCWFEKCSWCRCHGVYAKITIFFMNVTRTILKPFYPCFLRHRTRNFCWFEKCKLSRRWLLKKSLYFSWM